MTYYAWTYDEMDSQGPWLVMCKACINESTQHSNDDDAPKDWRYKGWSGTLEEDGYRCACCGTGGE
jgi:hypothetical protein